MSDGQKDDRSHFEDVPMCAPSSDEDGEALCDRCASDRKKSSSREISGCAGQELADPYENEENGGS